MPKVVNATESKAASGSASKHEPRPRRKARIDVDAAPVTKPEPPNKTTPKAAKPVALDTVKPAALEAAKPATSSRGKTPPSKRLSALDAAAQVIAGLSKAEAATGITAPDLIERMAKAGLWSSPGGKTPAATLYAAMIREITSKGPASRFRRIAPGRFAAGASEKARARLAK